MRFWDFLFALFVLAPIATGGIWIKNPSIKFEYTQAGPAALVLFLWAYFAWKKGRDPLQRSFFLRNGEKLWNKWTAATSQSIAPVLLAWTGIAIIWFLAAAARHRGFQSAAADLGIFTNGIWNLSQSGIPYSSIKGISLLADHQDFLIYPLAWIFRFAPSLFTLLATQALGLSSGGIALFLLGKQRLGNASKFPALFPFLFWACAPVRAANLFDFHPEVLMLPLFLFAVWALQSRGAKLRIAGIFLFLLALLAKESAGPVACGIGLAWMLGAAPAESRKFTRALGAAAIALGLGIFLVDTKILPQSLGATYAYDEAYAPFGNSLLSLAKAPFLYPQEFFSRVFGLSRLKFLTALLLPFLFLPLLGWPALVAALPGLLMLFLTAGTQRLSGGFHYAIEPMVGILMALPLGAASSFAQKHARKILFLLPLAALLQFSRSEVFHWRYYEVTDEQRWVRAEVLPRIAQDLSVSANSPLVPHLSTRHWVHFLPVTERENKEPVDCVLWDKSLNQTPMNTEQMAELEKILAAKYDEELRCASFTLHHRKGAISCLTSSLACPPQIQ